MESKFRKFCRNNFQSGPSVTLRTAKQKLVVAPMKLIADGREASRVLFATAELFVNRGNDVLRAGFLNLRLDGTLSIVNRPHYWPPPIA